MRLLPLRIVGYQGSRFPQAKPQLTEQALALSYPKADSVLALDPGRQGLAVPKIPPMPTARGPANSGIYLPELFLAQPPGPP